MTTETTRDPRLLSAEYIARLQKKSDGPYCTGVGLGHLDCDDLFNHIAAQENMLVAFRQAAVLDEKLIDLRSLLIECDSELSAQGHGRPPSPREHLLDLSWRLRSAYDTRR